MFVPRGTDGFGCPVCHNLPWLHLIVALHHNNCCIARTSGKSGLKAMATASEGALGSATTSLIVRASRFHDLWPVAGLMLAVVVNAAWMAVLGYGLFRLVL